MSEETHSVAEKVVEKSRAHIVWTMTGLILIFTYAYPRLLVAFFGVESPWTSYFYKYGFGAVFFFTGVYIVLRNKSCILGRGRDTFWFKWLILGFIAYASVHALWILAALHLPFYGD